MHDSCNYLKLLLLHLSHLPCSKCISRYRTQYKWPHTLFHTWTILCALQLVCFGEGVRLVYFIVWQLMLGFYSALFLSGTGNVQQFELVHCLTKCLCSCLETGVYVWCQEECCMLLYANGLSNPSCTHKTSHTILNIIQRHFVIQQ